MKRNKTKLVKFLEIDEVKELQKPIIDEVTNALGKNE